MLEKTLLNEIFGVIAQAPFVALFAYLWWRARQDSIKNINYLVERNKDKDIRIDQLIKVIEKFNVTLEIIKDRLR